MVKTFIQAVVAFVLVSIGSLVLAQGNPPTILCGSYRVAQNNGGCDNAAAQAYDATGRPTPYLMGQVRQTNININQGGSQYNYGSQYGNGYSNGWTQPVLVNPPAYYGNGYHNHRQQQVVVLCDGWNVPCGPAPQVVLAQQPNCFVVEKSRWDNVPQAVGGVLADAAIGALLGVAADKWRGTGGKYTRVGAALGAANGLISASGTQLVRVCQQPAAAPQAVAQQVPLAQEASVTHNPCAHDPGTTQGTLNLPGHQKHGQTVCARPGDKNVKFD